jgi:hypothetical protein
MALAKSKGKTGHRFDENSARVAGRPHLRVHMAHLGDRDAVFLY